ncbi:unnamed protein product [Mytilus edulis]|uniref:Uncharacterized protein n=1 Tax=Mytilus edulis TaxID=6550 RepID=A0A8S3RMT2_MYTED|nr:unnamed protein product [Mytilus edulis]
MIKHHKKHDLDELTGFFEQKLSELKDIKVKSEINVSVLKTEMQELQVQLSKGNKEFNETKKQILLNKEELMDLIHKHFDNLLKDAEAQWNLTRTAVSGEIELIKGNIHQMEDQKKQFDQILNPHKISEILISNLSTVPKYSPSNTVHQMSLQRAKFIPGLISKHKGTTQHFQYSGRLHKGPNYKMIRSYKTNNSDVSKIVHLQNGFAILANYRDELIQKVKFESDEIEVEIEIKTKVYDIAIMPNGEFLLSMKTSDLGLINANKDKDIFHFTPAGLILVSDYWDNAIHAINEEGNVTGWVEVQDIGYPKFPMSLHVDVQENLWVLLKEVESEWKTLEGTLKEEIKVMKILKDHMEKEREIASQVSYKPSKTSHDDMKGIFMDFLWKMEGQNCKLKKSYQTHLKGIQKIILLDNNQAIIGGENDEDVLKVQFDKRNDMKVLKAIPKTRAYDIGKMQNGDIIISVQEGQLKMYGEKDTSENFHSFYPLKTFGIHVNKDNEILVGISTGLPEKEEEIPKPGKIVVLNCEGSVKRTYENIKNEHSKECCKNEEGTHIGIIVSIDHNGRRMWTYGEDMFQFCPEDIAIMNSAGCICILANANIDILSKNGTYIAHLRAKITDSLKPNIKISSIAIDKDMNLYAGEKQFKKAKDSLIKFIFLKLCNAL